MIDWTRMKRDEFARSALAGMLAGLHTHPEADSLVPEDDEEQAHMRASIVKTAYVYANLMMEESEKYA